MSDSIELGQALYGNPTGEHGSPEWFDALVEAVLSEIGRVFWNVNQREWNRLDDPHIPGIEFRPYYWGDDAVEAAKPNLSHAGVDVRWYKHPGRGQSLNVTPHPVTMIEWFSSALDTVRGADPD